MLEKNKDYIEMRVSSTDCAFTQNAATTISIEGFSYNTSFRLPDPGESYVIISKEKFEKLQESVVYYMALSTRAQYWKDKCEQLQADNEHYREMAKQWEENYDLLLQKTGFDTVEELVNYLNSEAECDTLREAIASLEYSVKFARDERRDLSKKLDECEKDYISERDKAEALQTENEQLKKKLAVPDPFADYKELLEKLHSKEDIENFEWTLNHICGGQASVNGWMVTAKLWRRNYETLSKLVGFSSTEEIQDYLTNEAECDTLQEAISKLKDQVKYTCDEWYSANSTNNSWKAAAECNSPKELIEKLNLLRDDISGRSTVIESYKRAIEKWQKATGCDAPEAAKCRINNLIGEAEALESDYNHLLALTGFDNEGEIEDFLEQNNDRNKLTTVIDNIKLENETMKTALRASNLAMQKELENNIDEWQKFTGCDSPQKAGCKINDLCDEICKLKGDYDHLLELTGYKNEKGICAALVFSDENYLYITMRDLINSLKRKAKFIESNWQKATGCDTPEKAQCKITDLYNRIDKMKEAASISSNWTDKIVEG